MRGRLSGRSWGSPRSVSAAEPGPVRCWLPLSTTGLLASAVAMCAGVECSCRASARVFQVEAVGTDVTVDRVQLRRSKSADTYARRPACAPGRDLRAPHPPTARLPARRATTRAAPVPLRAASNAARPRCCTRPAPRLARCHPGAVCPYPSGEICVIRAAAAAPTQQCNRGAHHGGLS